MRLPIIGLGLAGLASGVLLWPGSAAAQAGAEAHTDFQHNWRVVEYDAGDGQQNDVKVTRGRKANQFVIDDRVPISAGKGCIHHVPDDDTQVLCTAPVPGEAPGPIMVSVFLGSGDDQLRHLAGDVRQGLGGPGDDSLTASGFSRGDNASFLGEGGSDAIEGASDAEGGPGDDHIIGTDQDDMLYGGKGEDWIYGLRGDDWLFGGPGPDKLHGGPGKDVIRQG